MVSERELRQRVVLPLELAIHLAQAEGDTSISLGLGPAQDLLAAIEGCATFPSCSADLSPRTSDPSPSSTRTTGSLSPTGGSIESGGRASAGGRNSGTTARYDEPSITPPDCDCNPAAGNHYCQTLRGRRQ